MGVDGAQMFARYAYPPNALGYCGPDDSDALLHYGATGVTDQGLRQLAQGFEGAWPYLELIAMGANIADPLDRRVVESYWVGTALLDTIGFTKIGNSMEDRFRARLGRQFPNIIDGVEAGGVPHHNFHVLHVTPWLGVMHSPRKVPTAVAALDRCRVRWGRVESVHGDTALVRFRPLVWDGFALALGEPELETARLAVDGTGFLTELVQGDAVSMHWDWICDRLTPAQLQQLRSHTERHLKIANTKLREHRTPLAVE